MTSRQSRECLGRALGSTRHPATAKRLYVAAACAAWPGEDGYRVLEEEAAEDALASAFSPRAAASIQHVYTAAANAYALRAKGQGIARKPGIDVVLHLLATRNISQALGRAAPQDTAVIVVVSEDRDRAAQALERILARLGEAECCLDPLEALRAQGWKRREEPAPAHAEKIVVSRTALFSATQR